MSIWPVVALIVVVMSGLNVAAHLFTDRDPLAITVNVVVCVVAFAMWRTDWRRA